MLIICYSQMQLSEVLIWYGLNNNNDLINKIGTQYGKLLLPAHNIAIGLGIYLATGELLPFIIGLIFYICIIIYYNLKCSCYEITELPECEVSSKEECGKFAGKLQWPFPHEWYLISFIISTILAIIYVKPFPAGVIIIGFYWFFFILTWFINYYNAFGSYWCWIMAFVAPLIVFVNYLLN